MLKLIERLLFRNVVLFLVVIVVRVADVIGISSIAPLAVDGQDDLGFGPAGDLLNGVDHMRRGHVVHSYRQTVVVGVFEKRLEHRPARFRTDVKQDGHVIGDRRQIETRVGQIALVFRHPAPNASVW